MLEPAADDQERKCDRKRDRDDQPLPDAAGDAGARRELGGGGAGKPANPKMVLGMDDDAGAEKTDAGEDSLDDTAGGIGELRAVAKWIRQHHDHGGGKARQTQRLQSDWLAMQIAVKTDRAARQRGDAKTQHNLGPAKPSDVLLF
jgi:hypothetical protein